MNPNNGWLVCPVSRWLVFVLSFFTLTGHASAEWKEKVLYRFQGGTDGSTPAGGVVFDTAGNLYGATQQGGGSDCKPTGYCGTVFQTALWLLRLRHGVCAHAIVKSGVVATG